MSTIFRGEEMTLCQIYFQSEAAYTCVAQLGELDIVQFRDVINFNFFFKNFIILMLFYS
jgi:V-type H+-transporting ATPase subunit a